MIWFSVFGEKVWLRESGLWNAGFGILAAGSGDDVVEVLLRAEALPFEHLHNRGESPTCWKWSLPRWTCCRVWGGLSLMAYPCLRHRLRAAWNDRAGARKIPHPLTHTPWCHWSPRGFVEVGQHPIPVSHIAREPRHRKLSLALFYTVEFVLRLARQERAVRYGLYGRVVGQGPHLHQIPVAANGVWIDVDCIAAKTSEEPIAIHSAYAGALLSNSTIIIDQKPVK